MIRKNRKKKNLDDLKNWSEQDFEDPKKIKKLLKKQRSKVIRIQELNESESSLSEDEILSMYMPKRRLQRFGKALLRLDHTRLLILGLTLFVSFLFILAFSQEKMGNFTINLDRLEMYRRGLSISSDGNFSDPTARLIADSINNATNTTLEDLPNNLDELEGSHNGNNYMAYTFYVRNAGKETLSYKATINLESYSKGAQNAVRVMVWKNGERTIYAEPKKNGEPEKYCKNFETKELVCTDNEEDFQVGYVNKYTVVIWMEGEDSDCNDEIVGGAVQFSVNIDALEESDTPLLTKFIQDIKDTLFNQKSIGAAGTDAPDYYDKETITWENRRNKN